jgi:predicted NBD/HSP70 family sugar kinase
MSSTKNSIKKYIINKLLESTFITRPEITTALKTRPATVLSVINLMKDTGIIQEPERTGRNLGSKASPIVLNPKYRYLIGIDFKINYTVGVVIDFQGNILFRSETKSTAYKTLTDGQSEICGVINNLLLQCKKHNITISGIGFADPGVVDITNEKSLRAVNIKGWQDLQTGQWLRDTFQVPFSSVYAAPMCRVYAEYHHQTTKPDSLYLLALGVGIGSAFMKKGELFLGDTNCAMEVGHIVVQPDGPLCKCGNHGCLEAIAGIDAIHQNIKRIISSGVHTLLSAERFSMEHFVSCVKSGDKVAYTLANEICEKIAISLNSIVAILNPSKIIISGELAALNDLLISTTRRNLALRCLPRAIKALSIEISQLDHASTAAGAALLLRNKILKNSPTKT